MKILLTFHPGVAFGRILSTLRQIGKEFGEAQATKIQVVEVDDDEQAAGLARQLRESGILIENYDECVKPASEYDTDPTAPYTAEELAEIQAKAAGQGTPPAEPPATEPARDPGTMGDGEEVTAQAAGNEDAATGEATDDSGADIAAASQQDVEQVLKAEQADEPASEANPQ